MPQRLNRKGYEMYPIERKEVWKLGRHTVWVNDLETDGYTNRSGLPVDVVYVDPPWNQGNVNTFYGKADMTRRTTWVDFWNTILKTLRKIPAKVYYIEMGFQNLQPCLEDLQRMFPGEFRVYNILYYRKSPCHCIRWSPGFGDKGPELDGIDDAYTPDLVLDYEKRNGCKTVLDFCLGEGTTLRAAEKHGYSCIGSELNKYRLANAIQSVMKMNPDLEIVKTPMG